VKGGILDAPINQVFFPTSFSDLFSAWNRFPNATPYAGGTELIRMQGKSILNLPPIILCMDKLDDLFRITRTERYLEIGSMVKLSQILWLGKIVPKALRSCLENIAGIQLRNVATIGGNICCPSRILDTSAPLTALDAQFELRNAQTSRWISAVRFFSGQERTALKPQELLTRVRLPLDIWDYSAYKKFYSADIENSEVMVLLAKTQKNILTDIRVIIKGKTVIRNKISESVLIGKQLPLSRRVADDFVESWAEFLVHNHEVNEISRKQLVNCIEINVNNLSE
jgi:CO/xanthine dehydrogenase FAD-binding subunit